jgi:drug/metabolite transporter (DMT)-like permease
VGVTAVAALLAGGAAVLLMRRGQGLPPNLAGRVLVLGIALLLIGAVIALTPSPDIVLGAALALGGLAGLVYGVRARKSMEAQDPGSSTRLLILAAMGLIGGVATLLIMR